MSRENENLSQSEVAAYLGVTNGTVSHWESGFKTPRAEHIISLCKLLDMDANILLGLRE